MKEITLTQGKIALVDDQDFEWLNQHKWRAEHSRSKAGDLWYAVRSGPRPERSHVYMHREIAGVADLSDVDHWDGDGLNNQRFNLRPCTHSQNGANRRKTSGCTSRYKGVYWEERSEKWHAQIRVKSRSIHLGYFTKEAAAAAAYAAAAKEHFGEFARAI